MDDHNFRAAVRQTWDSRPELRGKKATLKWDGLSTKRGIQVSIPSKRENIGKMANPDPVHREQRKPTKTTAAEAVSLLIKKCP
ncbi:unnamed protein product, partial [Amoebophrya sp. A25]|eukprot:GSA25T00008677001.1